MSIIKSFDWMPFELTRFALPRRPCQGWVLYDPQMIVVRAFLWVATFTSNPDNPAEKIMTVIMLKNNKCNGLTVSVDMSGHTPLPQNGRPKRITIIIPHDVSP